MRRKVAFALGGLGWQMSSTIVVSIGIYYYLPPEGAGLTALLSEEIFLGVLTAYGLARLVGGVVDSLADPIVGQLSDTSTSRFGRRRAFLIYGCVPMVGTTLAIFWPLGEPGSTLTFAYLSVMLALHYIFFTMYVGPYLSLVPEIARSERERIDLMRLRAMLTGPLMLGFGVLWLQAIAWGRDAGFSTEEAVRLVVVVACAIAFVCSLLPIFAVEEGRHTRIEVSELPWLDAIRITLRNKPFVLFISAEVVMILGATMMAPAMPYIARVLLGRDEGFAAMLGLVFVPAIAVGFAYIDRVSMRFGAKRTMVATVVVLGLTMIPLGLLRPDVPGGPGDQFNLAVLVTCLAISGFPIAAMLVLPMVILGQLIDLDEARTGASRSAIYFGMQGLATKWVYAASAAILSYLFSAYGRSAEEPWGVILLGPVGGVICLLSALIFCIYPEKRVLREMAEIDAMRGGLPRDPEDPEDIRSAA